jgi:hypothetical protein
MSNRPALPGGRVFEKRTSSPTSQRGATKREAGSTPDRGCGLMPLAGTRSAGGPPLRWNRPAPPDRATRRLSAARRRGRRRFRALAQRGRRWSREAISRLACRVRDSPLAFDPSSRATPYPGPGRPAPQKPPRCSWGGTRFPVTSRAGSALRLPERRQWTSPPPAQRSPRWACGCHCMVVIYLRDRRDGCAGGARTDAAAVNR